MRNIQNAFDYSYCYQKTKPVRSFLPQTLESIQGASIRHQKIKQNPRRVRANFQLSVLSISATTSLIGLLAANSVIVLLLKFDTTLLTLILCNPTLI